MHVFLVVITKYTDTIRQLDCDICDMYSSISLKCAQYFSSVIERMGMAAEYLTAQNTC